MGGYLCKVAARTAHGPVLRAYMAHKGRASLRTAGCLAEEALGALDSLIATRMAWYKALFARKCAADGVRPHVLQRLHVLMVPSVYKKRSK